MVFAGFAPTFYLNALFEQRELDALRLVHGAVFSLWPVLLMTQVMLAKLRRPDLHRRLGMAGIFVAAAMLLSGTALAIHAARLGFATPGLPPPAVFLAIPLFDMVVFAALVTAAVMLRRRRDDHARLMVLATLAILPAAFGRLPVPGLDDPILKGWLPTFALLLACVVRDVWIRRRVHRAWLWGGLLLVLSVPLRLGLANTETWQRFAGWLIAGQAVQGCIASVWGDRDGRTDGWFCEVERNDTSGVVAKAVVTVDP